VTLKEGLEKAANDVKDVTTLGGGTLCREKNSPVGRWFALSQICAGSLRRKDPAQIGYRLKSGLPLMSTCSTVDNSGTMGCFCDKLPQSSMIRLPQLS